MQNFTPLSGLIGGLMIGVSAAMLLLLKGRIAGVSGILESALRSSDGVQPWRYVYLAGLPLGVLAVLAIAPAAVATPALPKSYALLALAGLLVGAGARLAGGCTSGHGICGIPRLSMRSILATVVYMAAAALTVYVTRHLI